MRSVRPSTISCDTAGTPPLPKGPHRLGSLLPFDHIASGGRAPSAAGSAPVVATPPNAATGAANSVSGGVVNIGAGTVVGAASQSKDISDGAIRPPRHHQSMFAGEIILVEGIDGGVVRQSLNHPMSRGLFSVDHLQLGLQISEVSIAAGVKPSENLMLPRSKSGMGPGLPGKIEDQVDDASGDDKNSGRPLPYRSEISENGRKAGGSANEDQRHQRTVHAAKEALTHCMIGGLGSGVEGDVMSRQRFGLGGGGTGRSGAFVPGEPRSGTLIGRGWGGGAGRLLSSLIDHWFSPILNVLSFKSREDVAGRSAAATADRHPLYFATTDDRKQPKRRVHTNDRGTYRVGPFFDPATDTMIVPARATGDVVIVAILLLIATIASVAIGVGLGWLAATLN